MDATDLASAHAVLSDRLDNELASLRREVDQRFEATDKATSAALAAAEKATSAALAAAQRAVEKAETASERRFDSVNEFRSTLADQQATLMPRAEAISRLAAIEEKYAALSSRIDRGEGRGSGLNAGWLYLVAGVAVLGGILGIVAAIAKFVG